MKGLTGNGDGAGTGTGDGIRSNSVIHGAAASAAVGVNAVTNGAAARIYVLTYGSLKKAPLR